MNVFQVECDGCAQSPSLSRSFVILGGNKQAMGKMRVKSIAGAGHARSIARGAGNSGLLNE